MQQIKINQLENGNILIVENEIVKHVLPQAVFSAHPRVNYAVIIAVNSFAEKDSISVLAPNVIEINNKPFSFAKEDLLTRLANEISLNFSVKKQDGATTGGEATTGNESIPEESTLQDKYKALEDYESVMKFYYNHHTDYQVVNHANGMPEHEEYEIDLDDFQGVIEKSVKYDENNRVRYSVISGAINNIEEPVKVFIHDANNVTSTTYESIDWLEDNA